MNYYLAIDIGTHASRAMLYNDNGEMITGQVKPVRLIRQKDGHIEHDPQELIHSVFSVIENLLDSLPDEVRPQIKACGIATQRSTVIAFDHKGNPLTPAISWQDIRGASYLKTLSHSSKQIWNITGLPLSAHYSASKCRWLMEHHPTIKDTPLDDLIIAPLSSFLLLHLSDAEQCVVDHSNAQRMQLMDLSRLDWSNALLKDFQIPKKILPHCKPMCDDYGLLQDTEIPIKAVCGDQNAAIFGSGELSEETAFINLGSGAFILRILCRLKKTPRLLSSIACSKPNETHYLQEGTVNGAGNAISWFLEQYPIENWQAQLPIWLREVQNPPLFINSIGGLGSPWWNSEIKPRFIGGTDITDRFVAVIESIVFLIQNNLDAFSKEQPLLLLKVSGGLSQSDGICQKLANLSQLPVQKTSDREATARGVAWLASAKEEHWKPTSPGCYFKPQPDPALHERYQQFNEYLKEATQKAVTI